MVCCLQKCNFRKELKAPELLWTALGSLPLMRMVMLHTWNEPLSGCTHLLIFPDTGNEKWNTVNITLSCLCDSNSDRPKGNEVFNRNRDMRVMRAGTSKRQACVFVQPLKPVPEEYEMQMLWLSVISYPLSISYEGLRKQEARERHCGMKVENWCMNMAFPWERKNDCCPW